MEKLIEEATVDAYGPAEQATGFYTMIEENVRFPFTARAVGEDVEVLLIDLDEDGEELVAECRRRGKSYIVRLTELEVPRSVLGREWISAYFQFQGKHS
ncbi:MAG: calcium-binding protein [Thermoplasmata archaeon]